MEKTNNKEHTFCGAQKIKNKDTDTDIDIKFKKETNLIVCITTL